jgi:RimJ/RimL family protein N-acetyltransferase
MEPLLRSERLRLTPLADEHLELEYTLDTNADVMRYLGGPAADRGTVQRSHARRMALGKQREGLGFWVAHANELFVGLLMLPPAHGPDQPDGPTVADLGYRLHPTAWGHGYGREAATVLLGHAFDGVGMRKVIAQTRSDNHRSRRLLEDVGMYFVRDFRSLTDHSGGPLDCEYELGHDQWSTLRHED